MSRIKQLIGESIWQMGLPVMANKPTKIQGYQNPFSKALSSLTASESVAGSTAMHTTLSKQSFDASDISDGFEQSIKSTAKKTMKTLSLKPKPFNFKQ